MIKNIVIGILIAALLFMYFSTKRQPTIDTQETNTGVSVTKQEPEKQVEPLDNPKNSLNLSNQNLEKIPADVISNTNLEELDVSNNNLTGALPSEIGKLKKLKVLNASNNNMTGVPAEMGQLDNLEVLDLSNNKLTGLPYELGNLKNLEVLNLSGNNYSKQDLEVIKKGLSADIKLIL